MKAEQAGRQGSVLPAWSASRPALITHALIKSRPEDFVVIENTGIEPEGQGEHLWLRLRKRDLSTPDMCAQLGKLAGVKQRDIGYAGLKDRYAVTEQWVSLLWPVNKEPEWLAALPHTIELLQAQRHGRKLRKGALKGNQFTITLREVACDGRAALERRIEDIRQSGFPNYFGEQRFGRNGANVSSAKAMFNRSMKVRDRFRRGMFLSAARSYIFNQLLAERIRQGNWNQLLRGEVCMLEGSRRFFLSQAGDTGLQSRLYSGDIHPSGPLWGDGDPESQSAAHELEQEIAGNEPELVAGLAAARLQHDRRALRVIPGDLAMQWLDDATLDLSFSLPAGAYATALLRELVATAA